jgi:hypothetical protein
VSDNRTQTTLETELDSLSPEIAALSVVERSPNITSNGSGESLDSVGFDRQNEEDEAGNCRCLCRKSPASRRKRFS